jgi:hypothetical protein
MTPRSIGYIGAALVVVIFAMLLFSGCSDGSPSQPPKDGNDNQHEESLKP